MSVGACVCAAGDGVGNVSFLQSLDEIPLRGALGLEVPWGVGCFSRKSRSRLDGRKEAGREQREEEKAAQI